MCLPAISDYIGDLLEDRRIFKQTFGYGVLVIAQKTSFELKPIPSWKSIIHSMQMCASC